MAHPSDSAVQLAAEALIRAKVATEVGADLLPSPVTFDTGATVQVDGVASDESVLVEIFAHQGKLKGGQQKKVGQDALKLVTLGRSRPGARLILAFADETAASYARGKGWVAEALKTWNIEVIVVDIDQAERQKIRDAQIVQEMTNPADADL